MAWQSLTLSPPPALAALGSGLSGALNAVKTALDAVKAAAQAAQAFAAQEDAATTAYNAALQAAVSALNTALGELLDSTGLYVLVVPLPKKGLVQLATGGDPDAPGTNQVQAPVGSLLAQLPAAQAQTLRALPLFEQAFNPDQVFAGGNAYFAKTLAESLFDAGDEGRPRFQATDSWAYALVLAGGSDLTAVASLAAYLDRLVGQDGHADGVGATRGVTSLVPTNVRVGPTGRGLGAVVEWDPVPASKALASYDSSTLVATQFAVIRSTDFRARTAQRVADLFPGTLSAGATGLYGAQVLYLTDYDGIVSRWTDASVQPGTQYYYHVAFATRLDPGPEVPAAPRPSAGDTGQGAQAQLLGFDKLSGGVPFQLPSDSNPGAQRPMAAPPDWARTPSVAQLFPPVNRFLDLVREQLKTLAKSAQTAASRNDAYVAFLDREVARYEQQAEQLQTYIGQIQHILTAPSEGLYATTRAGTGNAATFLSDVLQQLSAPTDPNRPPFDNGDEYVTGLVLLAVGPDAAGVAAALAALQAFFAPSAAQDPVAAGVASVRTALAQVEQSVIDDILNPNQPGTNSGAFNNDMTPAAPGVGDAACATEES